MMSLLHPRCFLASALFCLTVRAALAADITVTPAQPILTAGASVTLQANNPVIFTLNGTGTLTQTSPTTATYTAPNEITAQHVLNGCMVLPSDSVFNTPIDRVPLVPNSSAWASGALLGGISVSYAWGTNVATNASPTTPQTFYYTHLLNGAAFPIPALPDKKRETGAYTTDGDNDHHMVVVNRDSCQFYETYQDGVPNPVCSQCTAQSGWTYTATSYAQPAMTDGGYTTDAAGLPLAPLTLHLSEIKAGSIKHALRFTACLGCVSPQFIWPATYSTGALNGAAPMGSRFRLRASFDISSFPPAAQVVLRGLQEYGMFLADIGTSGMITASSDITEDPEVVKELQTIQAANVPASAFDVVDESTLETLPNLSVVNPWNNYQTPRNQALIVAHDVNSWYNAATAPVALVPVTVGTTDPVITVQAGTPTFTIPSWVHGTGNTSLIWTVSPGAGSIDEYGNYTPPAHVDSLQKGTITLTSSADPSATTSIEVNLLPEGEIRIDTGSPVATVDTYGQAWLPDVGFETGSYNAVNDNYPSGKWKNSPLPVQSQTYMYTWGDDIVYRMHVPNGTYAVGVFSGVGLCNGHFSPGPFDNGLITGPMNIEAQGQIVAPNWNLGALIGDACNMSSGMWFYATVTNTSLEVALRATGGNNAHSAPILNALIIAKE